MKVALIALDATRTDFLGPYGGRREATPTINRLTDSGIVFDNCYSGAPWTPASHATMFTGRYPSHHDARANDLTYPDDGHYLPESLPEFGIRTQGIGAEPWLSRNQGVHRGFTRFHDRSKVRENLTEPGHHKIDDLSLLLRAGGKYAFETLSNRFGIDYESDRFDIFLFQEWAKRVDAFTFLNIPVAHGPYHPPQVFKDRLDVATTSGDPFVEEQTIHPYIVGEIDPSSEAWQDVHDLYQAGVAHADYLLSRALETIDDDTWIILTADHGDNLGENQRAGHQFSLHDNLINVPLIVSHPSLDGEQRSDLVSHVDIAPTVYDIVEREGYDVPPDIDEGLPGRSLLDEPESGRVVFAEYGPPGPHINALLNRTENVDDETVEQLFRAIRAAVNDEYKLLWYSDDTIELYRRGEEDGPELSEERPRVVAKLTNAIEHKLGPIAEANLEDMDAYVRSDVVDQLEALGYL